MQPSPAYWDTKRMQTGAAITRALRYMGLLKSSILDRVGRSSLPSRWQSLHYQGHVPQDDEDLDKGLGAESLGLLLQLHAREKVLKAQQKMSTTPLSGAPNRRCG